MSVDYSFGLSIGYRISQEEIEKVFPTIDTDKDTDNWEQSYKFDGEDYSDFWELTEAIARKVGGKLDNQYCNSDDTNDCIFCVDLKNNDDGVDFGRVSCGGSYNYTDVLYLGSQLATIKAGLVELGFKPEVVGDALVLITYNVS